MLDRRWFLNRWRRLYCRIVREKASPEYIARGWAIGMFFGCVIPFGFQLACSIPCAFLLRGSKIGATLGTLLTNHFTIFFIYPVQCLAGNRILGGDLTYQAAKNAMGSILREQSYEALMKLGGELAAAFFIGGLLLAAFTTPLTYWGVRQLVVRYRLMRERRALKHAPDTTKNT
ncbi:MAG: DUF2062 domain-containing protein [Victivallaceae bacterium]|nr:DUF2062 domain-containing protein [Victivallaceae bacterium]